MKVALGLKKAYYKDSQELGCRGLDACGLQHKTCEHKDVLNLPDPPR